MFYSLVYWLKNKCQQTTAKNSKFFSDNDVTKRMCDNLECITVSVNYIGNYSTILSLT